MAIATHRPALCATIAAAGIADSCYLGIVMTRKDARLCAEIKSEKLRQVGHDPWAASTTTLIEYGP